MDKAGPAQKQERILAGLSALRSLTAQIAERQAKLKERQSKLKRLHTFGPFTKHQQSVERFMERCQTVHKELLKSKKADRVLAQKAQAILQRDKTDIVAFDRALDRANEAVDRLQTALKNHLSALDALIVEADKILEST